jgi:hypothetical protein
VDVNRIGSVAASSDGVRDVLDGLEVRQATKENVGLVVEVQATVGDLADRSSKGQLLRCQIQFQDVVGWTVCSRWDWKGRCIVVRTGTEDQVETISGKSALELC